MAGLAGRVVGEEGRKEWRAHWLVVAAAVFGIMISQIHLYSLGVMIVPLEDEFGWTRAQVTSGLLLISIVVTPLAPVMGSAIDRFGPRRIALFGVALYCLSIALLSLIQGFIWMWWFLWLLVALGHLFIKPTVWVAALASLFSASRGLAVAVALSASGLVSFGGPLFTLFLVETFGWRAAYCLWGVLAAAVGLPILFLFFSSPRDSNHTRSTGASKAPPLFSASLRRRARSPSFVKLAAAALTMSMASMALIVNCVPILMSSGIPTGSAAAIAGVVGVSHICGRLGGGFLLDRFDARVVGALAGAAPLLSCLLLIAASGSAPFAVLALVLFGLSVGAEVDVIAYLASRFFGAQHFGTLFGAIVGFTALGGGLGPVLASAAYDATGSYNLVLWIVIPLSLVSGYLLLTPGAYPARD